MPTGKPIGLQPLRREDTTEREGVRVPHEGAGEAESSAAGGGVHPITSASATSSQRYLISRSGIP
jgi:hypothetical protein